MNSGHLFKRLFMLGSIVAITLVASFGPFVHQLPQVGQFNDVDCLSTINCDHFRWCPGCFHLKEAWCTHTGLRTLGRCTSGVDKIVSVALKQLGLLNVTKSAVMTGGLVQEQSFLTLPTPTPLATFLLTLLSISVSLANVEFLIPKSIEIFLNANGNCSLRSTACFQEETAREILNSLCGA